MLINRNEIALEGLNEEYIRIQGYAICKEGQKHYIDTDYIQEKVDNLNNFIQDLKHAKEAGRI